ncbi:MAG: hypothetical protein E6K17_06350 [Methanobacteriota archaeon]|nr:MAG: hypothetical protein E6K17_06350 [Euryarchaeota archaeon]
MGVLLAATALGQGLFTTVELGDDWVRLRSPFKRVSIARQDVAAVNLWMATPFEESKPLWYQAATLQIVLHTGRRIGLGMLHASLLKAIAARLGPA